MRLLLGFVLCFAFVLSGCSNQDVKTDTKTVKPPDKPASAVRTKNFVN
jgi:hypothetical protein